MEQLSQKYTGSVEIPMKSADSSPMGLDQPQSKSDQPLTLIIKNEQVIGQIQP